MAEMLFKEGLERLESVVSALENSELELEDALRSYEEGIKLYRILCSLLEKAEKRVEVLSKEESGSLLWKPYDASSSPDDNIKMDTNANAEQDGAEHHG